MNQSQETRRLSGMRLPGIAGIPNGFAYPSMPANMAGNLFKKRNILILIAAIAFAIIAAALPVLAEETEDENTNTEKVTVLEEVVVEGESPSDEQPQQDISAFGEVLIIDDLPGVPLSVAEALENAIGIQIRDFGGLGKLSTLTLRGLSSRDVLVMLDGIPLNSAALGGVDLGDIPMTSVERIEILRGPEAALYGDNSSGGIVNIIRKTDAGDEAQYSLQGGSYGYFSGDLSFSNRDDNFNSFGRLFGTTFNGGFSFKNDNGTSLDGSDDFTDTRENNEYDAWGFFGGIGTESGEWDLHFNADYYTAKKGIPGLTTFPTPDAKQDDTRLLLNARGVNAGIAGGSGQLDLNLSFLEAKRSYDDTSGGATGFPVSSQWSERNLGVSGQYAEFINDTHYLTSGAEWNRATFDSRDAKNYERDKFGFFIRDEISIGDSLLIPALRFDDITGFASSMSPKLGWRLDPGNGCTIKANWGKAFRAPTFEELYRDEGLIIGNAELIPEKTWIADIGLIYEDDGVRLEIDYYHGGAKDLIEYVLGSGHRYRPINFASAQLSGVEGSIAWDIDEAWRAEANIAFTRAVDQTDPDGPTYGKQIPGRPKWDAYTGLIYKNPDGDFGMHLTSYFAGGRYLTAANTKELDDDWSFNMGFTSGLGKGIGISFEVKNLFDADLMDVRGFPLPGRTYILSYTQEV